MTNYPYEIQRMLADVGGCWRMLANVGECRAMNRSSILDCCWLIRWTQPTSDGNCRGGKRPGASIKCGAGCMHWRRSRPHPFPVANRMVRGSYISLQSALAHNTLRQTGWSGDELTLNNWRNIVAARLRTLEWDRILSDVSSLLESGANLNLLTLDDLLQLLHPPGAR